jgi:hypothetical protein
MSVLGLRIIVITFLVFVSILSVYENLRGRPLPLWAWLIWGGIYLVEWILTAVLDYRQLKAVKSNVPPPLPAESNHETNQNPTHH